MPRQKLKFYCLKTRQSFSTDKYGVNKKVKNNRIFYYAITNNKGNKCVRILSPEQYEELKNI